MPYDPSTDPSRFLASDLTSPASRVVPITPDNADLPETVRAIRCDTGGTLVFIPIGNTDDEAVSWNVTAGEFLFVRVRRVTPDSTATVFGLI